MVAVALAASSVTLGGALLLATAGLLHLRDRRGLRVVLAVQRQLPEWSRAPMAALLPSVELTVGLAVVATILGPAPVGTAACIAQALTYLGFTLYTRRVRRSTPAAPCGCFSGPEPVNSAVVLRNVVFTTSSAGSAVTVALAPPVVPAVLPIVLAASICVAVLAWALPAVLATRTSTDLPFDATSTTSADGRRPAGRLS
ncbi:MauE/DoxX family redox-associated membrane protein [Salinispora arenicola]|uniref:Methylamine utilization protein MauE n=1 Tax=Salinispora arenicola TaxID=168697 RepID=A0A542XIG1_SALAC|nr:MauE/DoxX family redox-associated membrane protein [Salinispora arenicola]TQL35639.1 methylamine utilization protein MauE [Salinispora arenicola]GIM81757.1 hypothetical protein Sar04_03800 [Salinispora arenicola]